MTYVVIMDGFINEGWKNIYTLFEPSFHADKIKIYYAKDEYCSSEIAELMPRNEKHNFIFLSVQRSEHLGESEERVEYYRYRKTLDTIEEQFPYYTEHNNILVMLDYSQKFVAEDEYREIEKKIAYELDNYGYLADNTQATYLFSTDEMESLDDKYQKYVETLEVDTIVKTHREVAFSKAKESIDKLFEVKKEQILQSLSIVNSSNLLDEIEKELLQQLFTIEDKLLHREGKMPSSLLKNLLSRHYGVYEKLNNITILQFTYLKELDIELFLKVISLLSLINNAEKMIFQPYWLETESIEIDKDFLQKKLQKLELLSLAEEDKEEKYKIELYDIDSVKLSAKEIDIYIPDEIIIPWLYSKDEEEILFSEIDQSNKEIERKLEVIKKSIANLKKEIHNYQPNKKEKEYSKDELYKEVEFEIESKNIDYKELKEVSYMESIQKIEANHREFSLDNFKKSISHKIRKLPSLLQLIMLSLSVIIVMILPYILIEAPMVDLLEWYRYMYIIVVPLIFLGVFFSYMKKLRDVLTSLIREYQKRSDDILERLKSWYSNTIEKYTILFKHKIEYDNFSLKLQKYELEKRRDSQRLYHRNRIEFIREQVQDMKNFYNIQTKPEENTFALIDPNISASEIMEYSLFDEKKKIENIELEVTQKIKDIEAYGIIKNIKLKMIKNWKSDHA